MKTKLTSPVNRKGAQVDRRKTGTRRKTGKKGVRQMGRGREKDEQKERGRLLE